MDLSRHVEELRRQLVVAAEAGGDEASELAQRLLAPLDASTRLVLLDALSAAADEITTDLAPGSVDVRLRGRDVEFVVTSPPVDQGVDDVIEPPPTADVAVVPLVPPAGTDADEGGTSRITLRLPEPRKVQIEQAAGAAGLSVNAWLVRAIVAALDPAPADRPKVGRGPAVHGQHLTGWVR